MARYLMLPARITPMMNQGANIEPDLAALIAAARRQHQNVATPADRTRTSAAGFRPLGDGSSRSTYAIALADRAYCLKFYVVDAARRAAREWTALQFLTAHGFRAHPRPLHYSLDPALPAVIMARLVGQPLHYHSLSVGQLRALHRLLADLWRITPQTTETTFAPTYKDARYWLTQVQTEAHTLRPRPGDALTHEAYRLLHTWLASPDSARLLTSAPAVFSNGDLNPSNLLWDGQRLRLLDYEFSGWSDRAFDLADLVEHNQSRSTPDAGWAAFVADCDLAPEEQARFRQARQLLACTWLIQAWPAPDTAPDPAFLAQLARVRGVLAD